MSGEPTPWRVGGDGLRVRMRLTPKAAHDAIDGIEATADGPALKARVRALPSDGLANAAVARLLADWLGVPKNAVSLAAGAKSRVKALAIAGDGNELAIRAGERLARGTVRAPRE